MRHAIRLGLTALAALTAGTLIRGAASPANAADGEKPARMRLEVTDGKTCPPPSARTELRFRTPGGTWAQSISAAQSSGDAPDSIALLSYCPASVESRSVVHRACFVGEEPREAQALTATIDRAARPMPVDGKMAPPRPRSIAIPAVPYARNTRAPGNPVVATENRLSPPRPEARRATSVLFSGEVNP